MKCFYEKCFFGFLDPILDNPVILSGAKNLLVMVGQKLGHELPELSRILLVILNAHMSIACRYGQV